MALGERVGKTKYDMERITVRKGQQLSSSRGPQWDTITAVRALRNGGPWKEENVAFLSGLVEKLKLRPLMLSRNC